MYQYVHPTLYNQEIQGLLHINDNNGIKEVTGGECEDFFGFREVDQSVVICTVHACIHGYSIHIS